MNKIFLSLDISNLLKTQFNSDFGNNTIVTYHAMYDKPDVRAGAVIEWEKYKITYNNYEPDRVVLIGINRMITPSNRCDFIHAFLTVMTPQIPKISIDTAPFIGEPWRLYYHYQLVNSFSKFGANYSYPIEGEWRKWFERNLDECKFSPNRLGDYIVDTWTDLPKLSTTYKFYPPDEPDSRWYAEAKKFGIDSFRTPKLLLSNLVKLSNKRFGLDVDFDSYLTNREIKVPDIGIYRFYVEENRRRQGIYNLFAI